MFINLQRLLSITILLILVSTKLNCLTVGVQLVEFLAATLQIRILIQF